MSAKDGNVVSYWSRNAVPPDEYPSLAADVKADVVIIGAGFTGLSAACHLARHDISAIVLEAKTVGFGASGRNGGFVSSRFRYPLSMMARDHGVDVAKRMHMIGLEAVSTVERLVAELDISASHFARTGSLSASHDDRSFAGLKSMIRSNRDLTGDDAWTILDMAEIAKRTGSGRFVGGAINGSIGVIHPLNYVRGLARGAHKMGIEIHENTPALFVKPDRNGVLVGTAHGEVRARYAILASNGYSDMTPATKLVRRRVIPFQSVAIATAPIPDGLLETILSPFSPIMVETKRLPKWFHRVGNRLLVGGRGDFSGHENPDIYKQLKKTLLDIYPQLEPVGIEFQWSGNLAVTQDRLPHIGWASKNILYAMGYNGTGVAMSSLMGDFLARMLRKQQVDLALLAGDNFEDIPFYFLHGPATQIVGRYYQILDDLGR